MPPNQRTFCNAGQTNNLCAQWASIQWLWLDAIMAQLDVISVKNLVAHGEIGRNAVIQINIQGYLYRFYRRRTPDQRPLRCSF
jgi:hypothetical protein